MQYVKPSVDRHELVGQLQIPRSQICICPKGVVCKCDEA
jgi:hypothetical protein